MAKYIECDFLASKVKNYLKDKPYMHFDLKAILYMLEICPAADVVEVVRCKDCEYCIVNENHPNKPLICLMTKMCGTTTPEWFCAAGKKKEGTDK